jgi:DHA2 family multidrug resistance protein
MRAVATLSFLVFSLCFHIRSVTFTPQMDFFHIVLPQFLQGLGVACFFMPMTTIAFTGLGPERLAAASSLYNFLRTLSASIGTSVTITAWERREALHHTFLAEHVNPYNIIAGEWFSRLEFLGLSPAQAKAYTASEVTRQGFFMAANELFWLSSILMLGLIALVWLSRPKGGRMPDAGGTHYSNLRMK